MKEYCKQVHSNISENLEKKCMYFWDNAGEEIETSNRLINIKLTKMVKKNLFNYK